MKRMSIKDFRNIGLLQEVNRLFFHPLGLALEVGIDENGNEVLSGVWDCTDEEEGIIFEDGILNKEKANNVRALRKSEVRKKRFGYVAQRIR